MDLAQINFPDSERKACFARIPASGKASFALQPENREVI
jgi:hypothetical protein